MTTTIRVTLLSGRYGATPWLSGEGEGTVEFPPCPWRLLRAVFCGAFAAEDGLASREELEAAVLHLASQPPSYTLPATSYGQMRRFYPAYSNPSRQWGDADLVAMGNLPRQKAPKRRKQIDGFLSVAGAIDIHFPVTLSESQQRAIADCLPFLSYLGRSDYPASWELLDGDEQQSSLAAVNCQPSPDGELTVLSASAPTPGAELLSALLMNPQEAIANGYTWLPGQCLISYSHQQLRRAEGKKAGTSGLSINAITYAVSSVGSPVAERDRLWLTDALHQALVKRCPDSPLLRGDDGNLWLWLEEQAGMSLLHAVSSVPFSAEELDALNHVRRLYSSRGGRRDLLVVAQQWQQPIEYPAGTVLTTATPFLLGCHPKPNRRLGETTATFLGPEHQALVALARLANLPKPSPDAFAQRADGTLCVTVQGVTLTARVLESLALPASQARRGSRRAADSTGYHLELTASVPLALLPGVGIGFASHFGSGRLIPGTTARLS